MRRAMSAFLLPLFSLPKPTHTPLLSFPNPNRQKPCAPFFALPPTPPLRALSASSSGSTRPLATISSPAISPTQHPPPPPPPLPLSAARASEDILGPYLGCSMPGRRLKVAVLLSGGVDSSVALRLLHAAGHDCTAFYLKIWFQEDFENFWSQCPWDEDLKYARAVCDQVNVPLELVHLSDEYWNHVVSHIISEYRSGRTPNPDVLCNTRIKFGAFLEAIGSMRFDYVASGHYAHVIHSSSEQRDGRSILKLSKDMVKDQTYFLSHLSQLQLKKLLFPLGSITKDEVRRVASLLDLPNKDRKDSQGICFLGKVKFSDFVANHIGEIEGILLEAETGDYLGKHRGFWFYTIGQRQGLRLPGGPWYVVEKDVQNNVVFVSRNYFSLDKRRRTFKVGSLNWFSGSFLVETKKFRCKVRHGPSFYACSVMKVQSEDAEENYLAVQLSEDDQGLAAGQFAAFYYEDICLGSGVILDSWDEKCFPICPKALEIARMKDKSKLGKPVKIMNLEASSFMLN